ncbi:transposase [Chryseolinea lacunae]|uniref:Transposase n=1 Tax=Chryseolinea lacunae TaxID=2801331 RepID=A0ABS1KJQ9_9BACT|nr:transposase [Chryseolinea lacunae]MBL0739696.1 transposase [Chryseolinea lacunae]
MKKSKFSQPQILKILRQQTKGKKVRDICTQHNISEPTFYLWKKKFLQPVSRDKVRLRDLEKEMSQYKKILAEQTLLINLLKDLLYKKS